MTENDKLKLHKYSHPFRTETCTWKYIYLYKGGNKNFTKLVSSTCCPI